MLNVNHSRNLQVLAYRRGPIMTESGHWRSALRTFLVAVLSLPLIAGAQKVSKQRMSQPAASADAYSLKLHVTRSFVTEDGGVAYLHLSGVLDGHNVELATTGKTLFDTPVLLPGDYAVRLGGENRYKDGSILRQYDLLLANGQHEVFTMVGVSE